MHPVTVITFAFVIPSAFAGPWANICSTQLANRVRGCDSKGCGGYTNERGSQMHQGVDVICKDGSVVYSPFTGNIDRKVKPYGNRNAIDNGIQLSGSGHCIKMFHIKPFKSRGPIKKGQRLGIMLPMQKVYPGITSHVHIQNCDLTDPTHYL
ncbi:PREDICTED: leukocyte cell-derived chemotaxin-2-like [Crocodylus porosus]|uniref:leukocyte cell-derived chemotaxin-2-like n=1 Tax=Crocodylus porosus TaxID=8502 RepID=UPI00093BDD0D|nr:PREDICTED: leukocyte cell-derived chemotaxin-2-like [Crocodylus porosus]